MRKLPLMLATALIFVTLTGCGSPSETTTESNGLTENIYAFSGSSNDNTDNLGEKHGKALFVFVRFLPDGVVEWVDMVLVNWGEHKYNKYYGIYEIDDRKLTITLSTEEPILCVIHNGGEEITIGSGKLKYFDESKFKESDAILAQFDNGNAEQEAKPKETVSAFITLRDEDGNVLLTNEHIVEALYFYDDSVHGVSLELTEEGTELLAQATQNNIGKAIYIYLDEDLITAPTVTTAITSDSVLITGEFTKEQAQDLAARIK